MYNNLKKILIIGGKPIGSIDIVNYAKEQGWHTIVCDYLPVSESPAKQIADESWDFSTADIDLIVAKAKKERINAVFTGIHEFNIERCVEIAEKLNLPFYADKKQLIQTSKKKQYKTLFKKYDIPVIPEFQLREEYFEVDLLKIVYPVLIKPNDGNGGYGISICFNEEDLRIAYPKALKHSESKSVLIEEFIEAQEVSIFYIVQEGEILLTAMAERHTANGDKNTIALPVLYTFPSKFLELYKNTLNEKVIKAFKSLNLRNGMLFIQSFIKDNQFLFYDIGYRLTGTQEYHLLESICGFNPLKMMTDYAMTGKMGVSSVLKNVNPDFYEKKAANITFLGNPGVIKEFIGIDTIEKIPQVIKVVKNHLEGHEIPRSAEGTLNQVVLRVFIVADSEKRLKKVIQDVIKTIDVLSEKGDSILLPFPDLNEFV